MKELAKRTAVTAMVGAVIGVAIYIHLNIIAGEIKRTVKAECLKVVK